MSGSLQYVEASDGMEKNLNNTKFKNLLKV